MKKITLTLTDEEYIRLKALAYSTYVSTNVEDVKSLIMGWADNEENNLTDETFVGYNVESHKRYLQAKDGLTYECMSKSQKARSIKDSIKKVK